MWLLCCTPVTYIILHINYTSEKKKSLKNKYVEEEKNHTAQEMPDGRNG